MIESSFDSAENGSRILIRVLLLLSALLLLTCSKQMESPTGPLSCDPAYAGSWRWVLGSACGNVSSGTSIGTLDSQCVLTMDTTPPELAATGVHFVLAANLTSRTVTLSNNAIPCDSIDQGKIDAPPTLKSIDMVLTAAPKAGCCSGQYKVVLAR